MSNNLDDVFGSAPSSPSHNPANSHEKDGNEEWSDIPRLKEKHETEGYRDGVGKGKAETVQAGFDEGYTLGAVMGLRVGKILGLLQGQLAAIRKMTTKPECEKGWWGEQKSELQKFAGDAEEELKTESLFGIEYWGKDGIWKYEVPGEKEGREVLFPDVASAHPLIKKWEGVAAKYAEMYGVDLRKLERPDKERDSGEDSSKPIVEEKDTAPGAAKELSW